MILKRQCGIPTEKRQPCTGDTAAGTGNAKQLVNRASKSKQRNERKQRKKPSDLVKKAHINHLF